MRRLGILIAILSLGLGGCAGSKEAVQRDYYDCLDKCDKFYRTLDDPSGKRACRWRCQMERENKTPVDPNFRQFGLVPDESLCGLKPEGHQQQDLRIADRLIRAGINEKKGAWKRFDI